MPREKGFSEEQTQKKQELIEKYGYVLLEDIKGDIIVKDPSKFTIESQDRTKNTITDLVKLYDAIITIQSLTLK